MPIYTRRGDEGMTDLWNMDRVSKTDPRVEAYGTVDELNTVVGTARPAGYDDVDDQLGTVQNHLFVLQADLANPDSSPGEDDLEGLSACVREDHVEWLEALIDDHEEDLEQLQSFVLPGGSEGGAALHHARSVCRRAERRVVDLADEEDINENATAYINRLSDALFVLARTVNARDGVDEESPTY
jgi:cob(I)alamin adenosyltransferase